MKPTLSVIVPAFNEEALLEQKIKEYGRYLAGLDMACEILVVNDASSDRTGEIIERLAGQDPRIVPLKHKKNQGKGAAVKTGMRRAQGGYRLFLDADGATSIRHIEKLWPLFRQGYKVVIGSRSARDAAGAEITVSQSGWKQFLGKAGNLLIRLCSGLSYYDTQCGFKAFTAEAADKIFSQAKIKRWAFDIEILLLAKKNGFRTAVIPVSWQNQPGSRVGLKGYFITLWELLIIKLRFLFGR